MSFKKINITDMQFNPFTKIGKEWMLVTGGSMDRFNTMTASWGQLGVLWNRNVLTCYIRPNRYTYEFIEQGESFTASFLGEEFRSALSFCGSHSGRNCDKIRETGLTPVETDGCVAFGEADLVLVCRKLYSYDMEESGFLTDDGIPAQSYGKDPYHRAYICEITAVYVREYDTQVMDNEVSKLNDADTPCSSINSDTGDKASSLSDDMEIVVTDIIHELGVPAHIKGYHFLRTAILCSIKDRTYLDSVKKLLYPTVAEIYDTTSSRVERAIRHAIEIAWDRGDVDTLNSFFGYTVGKINEKPTNSEFIATITAKLRLKYKSSQKDN